VVINPPDESSGVDTGAVTNWISDLSHDEGGAPPNPRQQPGPSGQSDSVSQQGTANKGRIQGNNDHLQQSGRGNSATVLNGNNWDVNQNGTGNFFMSI